MKALLIILAGLCLLSFTEPAGTDFKKVFGSRYVWAVEWLKQNDAQISEYALAFNIPEKELKAIVFPELIRYNSLLNALEVESLKYLYVLDGADYADFSVGYFQMKPSFGEMIEKDAAGLLPEKYKKVAGWNDASAETEASRRERVKRLSSVKHQLIYLCVFYKICENRFNGKYVVSAGERVKLFATCYNAGYRRSYETLLSFTSKNGFYNHNYASISSYYYTHE